MTQLDQIVEKIDQHIAIAKDGFLTIEGRHNDAKLTGLCNPEDIKDFIRKACIEYAKSVVPMKSTFESNDFHDDAKIEGYIAALQDIISNIHEDEV